MAASQWPGQAERAIVVRARSISRPVWAELKSPSSGQVLAVFEHSCLLEMAGGRLISLVLPQIGNGPLNVVLEGQPRCFSSLQPGARASLDSERILAGVLEVALQAPQVWDPRPAWVTLRARREQIVERMPLLQRLGQRHAGTASLLQLLPATSGLRPAANLPGTARGNLPDALADKAEEGVKLLSRGMAGDPESLQAGAARLAGLGVGLTPAGDDFLCGLMLWAWLAHPDPQRPCQLVLETANTRTTTLSAAFLRAAGRGECGAAWHQLLAALVGGQDSQLERAAQAALAYGDTSGADTLAGFLCMAAKGKHLNATGPRSS